MGPPEETHRTFDATLASRLETGSHAEGAPAGARWLRTGDLGFHLDGELYVTGRMADLIVVDGRQYYPQDIEATAAQASPMVRRGYVAAFTVPYDGRETLVIVAERAAGTSRSDPQPAVDAITAAVVARHRLPVSEVRFVPAGVIPRTTSGKLARPACRAEYLAGTLGCGTARPCVDSDLTHTATRTSSVSVLNQREGGRAGPAGKCCRPQCVHLRWAGEAL